MADQIKIKSQYDFYPLTKERWNDFTNLFGEKGACAGCWCMYWRIRRKVFNENKGDGNKQLMRKIVNSGSVPGILAYKNNEAVGWCSVAPRDDFPVLDNSRVLKRIDDKTVWSVVCFFIKKEFRNKGLSASLLNAVKRYVKDKDGKIIEGYPIEPKKDKIPDAFAWVGLASAFKKAGFKEIIRRSETRSIMRFNLK
jgi:GNAT superfamily N-acetyltransferase